MSFLVNERVKAYVASAALHMYPDGLCESLPRPRAAFIQELRVLPQSDSLQFLKYIILHLQGGSLCLIVPRKTSMSYVVSCDKGMNSTNQDTLM